MTSFKRDLLLVLLGGVIGVAASIGSTALQISASQTQVDQQLAASREAQDEELQAARARTRADARAAVYSDFVASVDEHLASYLDVDAAGEADQRVFSNLIRVKLVGSEIGLTKAEEIASRTRRLTNIAAQGGRGNKLYFKQQRALDDFVGAVDGELVG